MVHLNDHRRTSTSYQLQEMGPVDDRLSKKKDTAKKEKRRSRKEVRSNLVNTRRNIEIEESEKVDAPVISEAEKLRLWRIEKKRKMDEEKSRRRPPFVTYINVKHTGLSPYRAPRPPVTKKVKQVPERREQPSRAVKTQSNKIVVNERRQETKKKNGPATLSVIVPPQNKAKPLQAKNVKTQKKLDLKKSIPEKQPLVKTELQNNKLINVKTTKKVNLSKKTVTLGKEQQNAQRTTRSKLKIENVTPPPNTEHQNVTPPPNTEHQNVTPPSNTEHQNGPVFQRKRLDEETVKLQELMEKWKGKKDHEKNLPTTVHDEILSVIGLTSLLISSKFKQFRTLVDDCAEQISRPDQQQRITPDDLDGFWEMIYIQVDQLYNKYSKLEKLAKNTWIDPDDVQKRKPKKLVVKTKPKKEGQSRFQDFLKTNGNQNHTKSISANEDGTNLKDQDTSIINETLNTGGLSKCLSTPKAVKNLITARRSRRSSMNIIMSMSGLGKFDISGTVLPSPKQEKSVRFITESL